LPVEAFQVTHLENALALFRSPDQLIGLAERGGKRLLH